MSAAPSSVVAPARERLTVAIVGRPNVGKSTLFNRLVGKKLALVDDQPGVTRDLREGAAKLADLRFTIVDTAGLDTAAEDGLPARMRVLTERALAQADVCLFVIDARAGVTADDVALADLVRKSAAHPLLVANKAEGSAGAGGVADAYGLGLGDPVALSAEHGEGLEDLYDALRPHADAHEEAARRAALLAMEPETDLDVETPAPSGRPLQVAVIGRPNAGKSTLINTILGEDRLLTGPEPGVTRDAIGLEIDWGGRRVRIFDTAGLRKKAKVQAKLEKLSVGDALRAIRFAEVVVLLLDVQAPLETQDLKIADLAAREGRAVVIAVNKWDLEAARETRLKDLREAFDRQMPQLRGAPMVAVSGLTGRGLDRLAEAIHTAAAAWDKRIATAALNRWLQKRVERHPPPAPSGRRLKLRYLTQAKARPPTFALFVSKADALPESYVRFLVNGLREDFGLDGAPIRLMLRTSDNPFAEKAKKRRS